MNFLAPLAFWFGLTIPILLVFYLLKRRRVPVKVPSTLLWKRYLAETQASAPFQRLRSNWLLILQIVLLVLAVLGLARPYLGSRSAPSRLRVLILDASASMQSRDVAPSRFEAARAEAGRWVDGLEPGQRLVILQAGPRTEVRQSATSDRAALRRALEACAVTDGPARLGEALTMAEGLVRDVAEAEIHVFSDGAVGGLEAFRTHNLPLVFHRVGTRRNNVALTSLEVRANPEDPRQRAVFCAVANLTPVPLETTLELSFGGAVVDVQPVSVPAGGSVPKVFLINQDRDGVFTVRHTAEDDLAADNQASVVSPLPQPIEVLLVTRGNRFLERALRTAEGVRLALGTEVPVNHLDWDLIVLDNVIPTRWPGGNVLAIRAAETNWFESAEPGILRGPAIVDWKTAHPVMRFVNLDNVQIAEARAVKPPAWGTVLAESPQGPLVVAGEPGRRRVVWVGFDILDSTWPLRISFPMFVANAVAWLDPATARTERLNIQAGDPLRLELPPGVESAEIRAPAGGWVPLPVDPGARELAFGGTDRQGIYQVRWGTNVSAVAVRALDPAESDSAPREEIRVGEFGGAPARGPIRVNVEVWRWLAVAALGVLLLEWWVYHRRTA